MQIEYSLLNILIFVGPVVVVFISVLAWWQSDASLIAVFSEVAQRTLVLGSIAGLTVGSLICFRYVGERGTETML